MATIGFLLGISEAHFAEPGFAEVILSVVYMGATVPEEQAGMKFLTVLIGESDTPQQLRQKFAQAIRDHAATVGLTIAANDVFLPSYEKG